MNTDVKSNEAEALMLASIDRRIRKSALRRSSTGSLYSITSKAKLKFRSTLRNNIK